MYDAYGIRTMIVYFRDHQHQRKRQKGRKFIICHEDKWMFLLIDLTASGSGSAAKLSELARRKLAILEPQSPDEPALFHPLNFSSRVARTYSLA